MNDNEPLAQLLEETRQTNRLLCRQLTWSRILAVVLAIIAAAAVVLAVRLGGELSRLTEMLNRLNMDSLNSVLNQLSQQLTNLDMDGLNQTAESLRQAADKTPQQREGKFDQGLFVKIPFQRALGKKRRYKPFPLLVQHHLRLRFARFLLFTRHIQADPRKRAIKNSLVLCSAVHHNPPNSVLNG